jgi:hypothetical protein
VIHAGLEMIRPGESRASRAIRPSLIPFFGAEYEGVDTLQAII